MADQEEWDMLEKQLEDKQRKTKPAAEAEKEEGPPDAKAEAEAEAAREKAPEKKPKPDQQDQCNAEPEFSIQFGSKGRGQRNRGRDRGKRNERSYHDGYRRRSRSRERYRRRDRSRSRSREKYYRRDRDGRRGNRDQRAWTPPEVREQRAKERELERLERDTRTVFASNLSTTCGDRELFDFFSEAGMVVDIRVIRDKYTKRCKGFAYIEFADKATVKPALELGGQMLLNQAVMVRSSEAEKNTERDNNVNQYQTKSNHGGPIHAQQVAEPTPTYQSHAAATAAAAQVANAINAAASGILASSAPMKLYVGSLHVNITSEDIRTIFDPFGEIDFVHLQTDAKSGRSQGYAFVQFKKREDGEKAIMQLNGLEIAGQSIKVSVAQSTRGKHQDERTNGGATAGLDDSIDDDGSRGLRFSAQSRVALMAKLTGGSQAASIGQIGVAAAMQTTATHSKSSQREKDTFVDTPLDPSLEMAQGLLGPASPIPTPCVLLKNMFDPSEETEADWDKDIAEDVKQECESKFGAVTHVFVDKDSKGFAYLKFALEEAAVKAKKSLHGRWFAGRKIACDFQFLPVYNKHFSI